MSESSYFTQVTSESAFRSQLPQEAPDFGYLFKVGASSWSRQHLLACRVICRPRRGIVLPLVANYNTFSGNQQWPMEMQRFINGPQIDHRNRSEHFLVRQYGASLGQVWAALGKFMPLTTDQGGEEEQGGEEADDDGDERMEGSDDDRGQRTSKRTRRNTIQENFIDPTTAHFGSSSPIGSPSDEQSSKGSSAGYVASEGHSQRNAPTEDITLRLATCVIRHILFFAPPQDSSELPLVVEYRDAKRAISVPATKELKISATDDGGLYLWNDNDNMIQQPTLAILETKKRFHRVDDGRPVIVDECLAQMTGEALAVRLAERSPDSFGDNSHVFIIHPTQNFICFLQFDISNKYLDNIATGNQTEFINVHVTPWYDLHDARGRKQIVANLCSIMAWSQPSSLN
ncbi:hypothetical protein PT974_11150 [Cladobotryum mycophilum]|uniref:Uncharacterized protein n=1 Tax=Cladobotryum mycophilum TaxID=491253 RepID=A0ABR0S4X6_9HYPO